MSEMKLKIGEYYDFKNEQGKWQLVLLLNDYGFFMGKNYICRYEKICNIIIKNEIAIPIDINCINISQMVEQTRFHYNSYIANYGPQTYIIGL